MPDFKRGKKIKEDRNLITWFEIPVEDFDRAKLFYEGFFDVKIDVESGPGFKAGFFPMYKGKVTGAIVMAEAYKPSKDGAKVFIDGNPDLQIYLDRVIEFGGKILTEKTFMNKKTGHLAWFEDTEGNRLGLISKN